MRHDDQPTKYCSDCDTHFKAAPGTHGEVYHNGGDYNFIEGTWRDAERRDRFQLK